MFKRITLIIFLIFFSNNLLSYNYEFDSDNTSINLKFEGEKISEIKFEFLNNNQNNFGIITFNNEEIDINLNTNVISYDEFKKYFPKPQKNQKLKKKINFSWEIGELIISDNYSLFSNKLEFTYDQGFEALTFFDSKKDFELSILPNIDGNKQIYILSKNAGQFFYAQKITKDMIGGVLIGKGIFRKFDDYDLTIKVKDFSINKDAKFYNLIFTSRLLDVFSLIQNKQDEFNYLEVPINKKGKKFNFDHGNHAWGFCGLLIQRRVNSKSKNS
jgi:hypothetical protein